MFFWKPEHYHYMHDLYVEPDGSSFANYDEAAWLYINYGRQAADQ
jgi:hypothetical protein